MDITIGSYTIRAEIVLLSILILWILFGHLLYGTCRVSVKEAMSTIAQQGGVGGSIAIAKTRAKETIAEAFTGMHAGAHRGSFSDKNASGVIRDPSTWASLSPSLTFHPEPKSLWERPSSLQQQQQQQQQPEGQHSMGMFGTTAFKPECCPNAYSTSSGCACMSTEQYDYLRERGGNNVPFSQY